MAIESNFSRVFNLGFPNEPSKIIVKGLQNVGGLVGKATSSILTSCGVERGLITGLNTTGGIVGRLSDSEVNQVYTKGLTYVQSVENVGSLFGFIDINTVPTTIKNVYSKGITSGNNSVVIQ